VTPILELKGVTKAFGGVVANNNITLTVPKGKIVGLIGPNGSGKTTLFNSIVGYHPINAGSIRFDGRELSTLRMAQIARLGLLRTFQQTRIFGKMTCMQNMLVSVPRARHSWRFMLRRAAPQDVGRAEELLQFVGLYAKCFLRAGDLSFGQQRLLELAMALMSQPQMLLLDEPTAGINPTLINGLMNRLRRANREFGITLLVIEHNMRVIMNLAEYIYCLAHGELLAEGEPEQVRKDRRVIDAYLGAH
jgi:ABC-type branched-subunit amino acid transport system ATPase component